MLSSSIRHIPAIFTRKNQKSHHMMKKPAKGGSGLAQPVAQIALPVALFFSLARSAKKIDLVKTRLPNFCPGGLNSGKRKR